MKFRILLYSNLAFLILLFSYHQRSLAEFEFDLTCGAAPIITGEVGPLMFNSEVKDCNIGYSMVVSYPTDWVILGDGLAIKRDWTTEGIVIDSKRRIVYGDEFASKKNAFIRQDLFCTVANDCVIVGDWTNK